VPAYTYRATARDGATRRGLEEAPSAAALERALGARGLYPLEVRVAEERESTARRRFRSRRADVVEAMRYLATLTGSGFPLDRALGTAARVAARADVADALADVRARVRSGAHLADALAEHVGIFPRAAVGMTRAGERGGHLPDALTRLADQLEREHALQGRLMSAMLYPAVMLSVGAVSIVILLIGVLPRLVGVLQDAGATLPRSTALLIALGSALARGWPLVAIAAVGGYMALASYLKKPAGQRALHALLLRLPVVGGLRRALASARLGRSLATLLRGGLPMLAALDIAADAVADHVATEEIRRAREEVRAGGRLAAALRRGTAFRFVFLQMVEVGEDGGQLTQMLERGAAAMERDLESGIEQLVRLAEPAMIVVLGGLVGFIALALLQAIYSVNLVPR
jgi:type II secretory pathway component PulF